MQTNSEVIAQATERIATIVNNLKDFARLDEAEFQDADLHAGLDATLALMQHEFGNDIQTVRDYGQIPSVPCRPNQLNQVFMTLFSRAVHSIDRPGTITIRTFVRDGLVCVAIGDDGRGIPEEQLGNLFELGLEATDSRVSMDTSLPSAFNIVKGHDGDLTVESKVGEGTKFTLSLPAAGPGADPRAAPSAQVSAAATLSK